MLRSPGWLARLLALYIEHQDEDELQQSLERARATWSGLAFEDQADRLTQARLTRLHLRRGRQLVGPALRGALEEAGLTDDDWTPVGVLITQWDLLQLISALHENTGGPAERQLEILTIKALWLGRFKLARKLHAAHLSAASGKPVKLEKLAAEVERHLSPRGELPAAHQALRVGIGLAFLEARALARIASAYYERAVIEEDGVARLRELSAAQKVGLVEVLLALAWADGEVNPAERRLIEQQIGLADLPVPEARRLLGHLDSAAPELSLQPVDAASRRFVLEQAVLLSLVDDEQAPSERRLLERVCRELGGDEAELNEVMLEVMAFYHQHRDGLHAFGPVSAKRLDALRASLAARAQQVVKLNLGRVLQEVKETGELARLLTAASVRELSQDEAARVKAQLLDVCKTVPALAIFLLPGGALLLPILIKALPFNVLPTAFQDPLPPRPGELLG
ncbi:MAG: TerB family tellurite resistance protein [Planctomycetota bacterium]